MSTRFIQFKKLKECIDRGKPLIIQTHDYPDHDAIASAYALQQLFAKFSHPATICYGGIIQSPTLKQAVSELKIEIHPIDQIPITGRAQIIMVDGSIYNGNMQSGPGNPIAIIDHHAGSKTQAHNYTFSDVRGSYGACSTIVAEYFKEADIAIPPLVATVLMMGIMMDTGHFTRGVHQADIHAFAHLYPLADWDTGARLLRNSLTLRDADLLKEAIVSRMLHHNICFVPVHHDVSPDVIGIIADFFLGLQEVTLVMAICLSNNVYKVSVRSEETHLPADKVVAMILEGIGRGGGHVHMAGGIIAIDKYPGDKVFFSTLLDINTHLSQNS